MSRKEPYPPEYDLPDETVAVMIQDFIDSMGCGNSLDGTLRAIDKHNLEHVWLILEDGRTLYYWTEGLDRYPTSLWVVGIGVGAIAWDGSDWEYANVINTVDNPEWEADLAHVREHDLPCALEEHQALYEEEEEEAGG